MKIKRFETVIKKYFGGRVFFVLFVLLLIIYLFTRFTDTEHKNSFTWDQLDNAWMAKNIIIDHKFPLVGMQAKGNTGFFIGPYYYYLIVPFYLMTNLDPSASGIIAGIIGLFTFFLLFFIVKDIFNEKTALIAIAINTISFFVISTDRVQWPVNFIVPVSLLIFYSLFKIINGKVKFILLLVLSVGFSFHIHFTSIFYLPLILLTIPLFPRNKETLKYLLYSLPILLVFLFPLVVQFLGQETSKATFYISSTFLGFHLRRFFQLTGDGGIQFDEILNIPYVKYSAFIILPVFFIFLLKKKVNRKNGSLIFLSILWVIVPWIVFSTYRGEITDYYFYITRPIVFLSISFLLYQLLFIGKKIGVILLILIIANYSFYNLSLYNKLNEVNSIAKYRKEVSEKIKNGEKIEFSAGDPKSFLFYIYKQRYEK